MSALVASVALIASGLGLLFGPLRVTRVLVRLLIVAGRFAAYAPFAFLCLITGVAADIYCIATLHLLGTFPALALMSFAIFWFVDFEIGPILSDGDGRMNSPNDLPRRAIVVTDQPSTPWIQPRAQPPRVNGDPLSQTPISIEWEEPARQTPRSPLALRERLHAIRAHLDSEVVGQSAAKQALLEALARAFSGLRARDRGPVAALVFCGPTGVGKTELAESLARALGWPSKLFPLGQVSKEGLSWRLFGPERGYSGSHAGGELTQFLRFNPESVVIFDEIEKGLEKDPSIAGALLNLLSEGVALESASGNKFDASRCLVIFTSNALGSEPGTDRLSHSQLRDALAARMALSPEFANRLTGIVSFRPLADAELAEIARRTVERMLLAFAEMNSLHGLKVGLSAGVLESVIGRLDRKYGVRNLQDVLDRDVSTAVVQAWMAHDHEQPRRLHIEVVAGRVMATFA